MAFDRDPPVVSIKLAHLFHIPSVHILLMAITYLVLPVFFLEPCLIVHPSPVTYVRALLQCEARLVGDPWVSQS